MYFEEKMCYFFGNKNFSIFFSQNSGNLYKKPSIKGEKNFLGWKFLSEIHCISFLLYFVHRNSENSGIKILFGQVWSTVKVRLWMQSSVDCLSRFQFMVSWLGSTLSHWDEVMLKSTWGQIMKWGHENDFRALIF